MYIHTYQDDLNNGAVEFFPTVTTFPDVQTKSFNSETRNRKLIDFTSFASLCAAIMFYFITWARMFNFQFSKSTMN